MTLYKTLNGTAGAYGYGCWSLPTLNSDGTYTPGDWMPPVKPVLCKSGYHYCRDLSEVVIHLASEIYEIEVRGEINKGLDKACAEQARLLRPLFADTWTPEAQALWAVDCARAVANLTTDPELIHACLDVAVARVLYGKEWEAAWEAAWDAARVAAWDAMWAAARVAAWDAMWAAAGAAASTPAAAIASTAAAADAARAAADAARAAADATGAAAWYAGVAAWYATRSVSHMVRNAHEDAQVTLLERYLAGEQGPLVERETS